MIDLTARHRSEVYRPFHAVLGRAERLASKVDGQRGKVRIPVFPGDTALAGFSSVVPGDIYREAAGGERFGLFNIAARLQSIVTDRTSGQHLLAPRFGIRVFSLYPDRVYFTADRAIIEAIAAAPTVFAAAPHRQQNRPVQGVGHPVVGCGRRGGRFRGGAWLRPPPRAAKTRVVS